MAQKSYFFDSVDHDRIYTAADFARVFGAITGRDGVIYGYGDELAVSPGSGMNVTIGVGAAFVQGRMLEVYDQAETVSIATADATNPRIDRVVVRVDLSSGERRAYLAVKVGTPAATPAAPLLQQDATIWEMSLAQVRVGAGATGIVAEDITDEWEYTGVGSVADDLAAHKDDYEKEATEFELELNEGYAVAPGSTCRYYKKNGFVFLVFGIGKNEGYFGNNEHVARLPVGFRPKSSFIFPILENTGADGILPPHRANACRLYNSGELATYISPGDQVNKIYGCITYYAGGGTV